MLEKKTSAGSWLQTAARRLAMLSDTAVLETQVVLAQALGVNRSWLLAHQDRVLADAELQQAGEGLERLLKGEPLAYITGKQEFFGLDFAVNPAVLIPRPETELLVEIGLRWLKAHPHRHRAADVGTGSGAIAVSLAKAVPDLWILAADYSHSALCTAQKNLAAHQVRQQVHLLQTDLLSAVSGPFDLVCANLPYVPAGTLAGSQVSRYEPWLALDGGADGLCLIERLVADSPRWLAPGGCLLMEIEYRQGGAVLQIARSVWPDSRTTVQKDLAGLDRLLVVETA